MSANPQRSPKPNVAPERLQSIEALMRAGVPLHKIEEWLDFQDNQIPPNKGKPSRVPAPGGLHFRPTT